MINTTFVSIENVQRGIQTFQAQRGWPRDFHNSFYQELHTLLAPPVNPETWNELVNYLAGWRALRPFSKQQIYLAGLPKLDRLNHHLHTLDQMPAATLETVSWSRAAPLFQCAAAIKAVASPVFGSKLCHFLRPNIYPVVDQAILGIGNTPYATYWQACQAAWNACLEPEVLIAQLRQAIGDTVSANYPWSTKIVELCTIGARSQDTSH